MKKPKRPHFFRDLGGIVCADGKKVIDGMLYRSGHLSKLKEQDAFKLHNEYNIDHIVDLRSDSEVKEKPDRVGQMTYHRYTPLDDTLNPSVNRHNRLSILKKNMAKEGGTLKHLCDVYRSIVNLPESIKAYRSLFDLLLEGDGGVLWHCTQGKDRTGLGSVMVLLALGADKETIMQDYMRYNRLCRFQNTMIFIGIIISRFSLHMARSLDNLMSARRDYLKAAFDEMEKLYGSTEGYLRDALKLSDDNLIKLRSMYLA